MDIAATLLPLLTAGAALAAQGAVGEFAKSGGKAAFEALKARLAGEHKVAGLAALDRPGFVAAVRSELAAPDIAEDPEIAKLAAALRAAIEALPPATLAACAVDIETIRSDADLLIEGNEGVRARLAESKGPMTIKGNTAPGKP